METTSSRSCMKSAFRSLFFTLWGESLNVLGFPLTGHFIRCSARPITWQRWPRGDGDPLKFKASIRFQSLGEDLSESFAKYWTFDQSSNQVQLIFTVFFRSLSRENRRPRSRVRPLRRSRERLDKRCASVFRLQRRRVSLEGGGGAPWICHQIKSIPNHPSPENEWMNK